MNCVQSGPDPCAACGANDVRQSSGKCRRCGFTYFGGALSSRFDYEHAYNDDVDYNALHPDAILRHYAHAPNTSWALTQLRRRLENGPLTLVEFGASQGAFIRLSADIGVDATGYELAPQSVQYGRDQLGLGDRIRIGHWRARQSDEQGADVVCAFETLEHLTDPVERLRELATWVLPGGLIILSVPNERRLSVRLHRREQEDYPPHHLGRWTSRSMGLALRRAGLVPHELTVSALSRSEILGVLSPKLSARRAAELGSFRPIKSQVASDTSGVTRGTRLLYPFLSASGLIVARGMAIFPELGSRLLVTARVATHG